MKTHDVKEEIVANALESACFLYVEIDPQPYEGLKVGITYPPPIRIGDTLKSNKLLHPSTTMPIELADKTFKVVGVDVELMLPVGWDNKFSHSESDKKWFWSYKLEEIK